jgi:RNA polymerase sigma-70 factor (ECF subfamily)
MGLTTVATQPALQIIQQDRQALEALLTKYSPAMYRAALRKLGNPADAEDALQDALLSASRHIAQFKGESHISSWLVAIAVNAARLQLRRRQRQPVTSLEETYDDGGFLCVCEPADSRSDPEETYGQAEMREIVSRLSTKLTPSERYAFRLRVVDGLSVQEAADVLGVAKGTVKSQWFRARARIRALIHKTDARRHRILVMSRTSREPHKAHDASAIGGRSSVNAGDLKHKDRWTISG